MNMQNIPAKIAHSFHSLLQILIVIALAGFITIIAYIISWPQATSSGIIGTDTMSAYVYTEWLNKSFPLIPFWYPLQGGGISFTDGYPYLAHYLVTAIHHFSGLSLITAFNILEFLSFPISAIGIVIFAWKRLRYPSQPTLRISIGLIAAIFFLISPITYIWTYQWGFYAESVSYMFILPSLFFLDYFIEKSMAAIPGWKKRISLVIGLLFLFFAFMTHFSTGLGIVHVLLFIIASYLFVPKNEFRITAKRAVITSLLIFIPFAGIFFWRYYDYLDYAAQVAKGGFNGYIRDPSVKVDQNILPSMQQLLGLKTYAWPDPKNTLNDWAMPLYVWIAAFLALLFSWKKNKKIFILAILAVYGFFSFTSAWVLQYVHFLGPLALLFDSRAVWTVYRSTIPLVAAYGIFLVYDTLLNLLPTKINIWKNYLQPLFSSVAILVTTIVLLVTLPLAFEKTSATADNYIRIGHRLINTKNIWDTIPPEDQNEQKDLSDAQISLSDSYNRKAIYKICVENETTPINNQLLDTICNQIYTTPKKDREYGIHDKKYAISQSDLQKALDYCQQIPVRIESEKTPDLWCNAFYKKQTTQLNPAVWPKPQNSDEAIIKETDKKLFEPIPDQPLETRFDLSGNSASIVMRAPLITDVSQTQVYINQLHLASALWNFQSSTMYSSQPIYQKTGIISELAKWYGYEYLLPGGSSQTPFNLYKEDPSFEPFNITIPTPDQEQKEQTVTWWHYKNPTTLASWSNKPAILFIGDEKHYVYDQAFKVFSVGLLPYDQAIPFYKYEYVDDYSLQDLQKFDALYLSWYKYRDSNKGHELLDQYVKNGGSLFIDTGWQYNAADWEIKGAPPFFPTNELAWGKIGPNSKMMLDNLSFINYQTEQSNSGPLTESSGSWGVSIAQDVRKDAKVIMQSGNTPLMIAYKYGRGKVIWSGYNTIPHIEGLKNENTDEIKFVNAALQWLIQKDTVPLDVQISRSSPDKITFTLNNNLATDSTFYWRESYHPKWHAYLNQKTGTKKLDIYRAGPRLMGIRLADVHVGDVLTLKVEYSLYDILLRTIAGITAIGLILYLFKITKPLEAWIKSRIHKAKKDINSMEQYKGKYKIHEDPNSQIN